MGKPKGKRPLGKPRHWRDDNIKIELGDIELGGMYWIGVTQDRDKWKSHVNMVMNLSVA
jgi:hypothetical protein